MASDGQSVRGAAAGDGTRPPLLAAVTPDDEPSVLAHRPVLDHGSATTELARLVAGLDLAGKVVTGDARHPLQATGPHLVGGKDADDILTVKAHQPTRLAAAQQALAGSAAEFDAHPEHPRGHPPQPTAHRARRGRDHRDGGRLPARRPGLPRRSRTCRTSRTLDNAAGHDLARRRRGPWDAIENKPPGCATPPSRQDAATFTAPGPMAVLRNTLITAFRRAGGDNLKKARRHVAHGTSRYVDPITKPVKTVKGQT